MQPALDSVEARFGFTFPAGHRRAMMDPFDPVHQACDFLVPESPHELLRLAELNALLHGPGRFDRWPSFLIAFASNGCADFYAYDLRSSPPTIVYVDPDLTLAENLSVPDGLWFPSFDEWYADRVKIHPSAAR